MSNFIPIDFKRFSQLYNMMEFIGAKYGFVGFNSNNYKINIDNIECELYWNLFKKEYYYRELKVTTFSERIKND